MPGKCIKSTFHWVTNIQFAYREIFWIIIFHISLCMRSTRNESLHHRCMHLQAAFTNIALELLWVFKKLQWNFCLAHLKTLTFLKQKNLFQFHHDMKRERNEYFFIFFLSLSEGFFSYVVLNGFQVCFYLVYYESIIFFFGILGSISLFYILIY